MKVILSGNPYSTNNIYYHHGNRAFIKAKAREQKEAWAYEAYSQWKAKPMKCPVKIKIVLYFGDKRKRDWDNHHKLAMDSLTGVVWTDDSQIVEALVKKDYCKENPRIELEIKEL